MMRALYTLLALLLLPFAAEAARCTGKADCKACVNCSSCRHCRPMHQQKGVPPVRVRHCGVCAPKFSNMPIAPKSLVDTVQPA